MQIIFMSGKIYKSIFGPTQMWTNPKFYSHIVAVKNILCLTKRRFVFSKIGFCAGTKVFEGALNAVKFLGWLKKIGPTQNILGPVKGQGIREFHDIGLTKMENIVIFFGKFRIEFKDALASK